MTEAEWLYATDPQPMLEFLRGKASGRKLRLLSCAFARSVIVIACDSRAPGLLSLAEQRIEFAGGDPIRSEARREMSEWYRDVVPKASRFATSAIYYALSRGTTLDCQYAAEVARRATGNDLQERVVQAHLLRDIVGNPFRPVAFDPSWPSEPVLALASALYADRAFDRLPILADALEEAGCDHPDILNHCRGPGPHVRGCWAVDLVLGKS